MLRYYIASFALKSVFDDHDQLPIIDSALIGEYLIGAHEDSIMSSSVLVNVTMNVMIEKYLVADYNVHVCSYHLLTGTPIIIIVITLACRK